MTELRICHLYPDLLNLYGDRGNIITLQKRCEWRGISATLTQVSIGDPFVASDYDLIFIGGGQDYEQEILQPDLIEKKGDQLRDYIANDGVMLAICGGYQLLGHYYQTLGGEKLNFLGALDLYTEAGTKRMIGNIVFQSDLLKNSGSDGVLIGFENHSGKTYLGSGLRPLGKVLTGGGNNGEDGYEGAVYKNTYCSYSHGSLLPKNPVLADHLIRLALEKKYGRAELTPLDDSIEMLAHDSMVASQLKAK